MANRNPNFDIIRAVLSLWIVLLHCLWFAGISGGWWAWSGRADVEGFIVLSGYVITKLLLVKREPYHLFIYRRFLRLFPAFLACLLIAVLVRSWTVNSSAGDLAREASENTFFWPQLLAHLSLLFGMVPSTLLPESSVAFLPPAWSISLEMQLYLAAPLVLWSLYRFRLAAAACLWGIGLFSLLPQVSWRLHDYISPMGAFLPQKLAFFLLGMALCLWHSPTWKAELGGPPIPLAKFAGAKWLASVGQISYSLYLIHYPLLHLLRAIIPDATPAWATAALLTASGVPISLIAAKLLYVYVEKPGIALGR